MGSFRPGAGNQHLHWYFNFTGCIVETVPKSLRLSCGSEPVSYTHLSEALKGSLRMVGNHSKSAKAEGSLTATPTGGAGTKVGLSDPVV